MAAEEAFLRKVFKIILQNKQKNKTYNVFLIDFF